MKPIKSAIPRLMKQQGISTGKLWKDLGISFHTAQRWAAGEPPGRVKSMQRLAEYFNVSVQELFE